jgi:hypothetical protein
MDIELLFEVSLVAIEAFDCKACLCRIFFYGFLGGRPRLALSLYEGQDMIYVVWDDIPLFSKRVRLYLFFINS